MNTKAILILVVILGLGYGYYSFTKNSTNQPVKIQNQESEEPSKISPTSSPPPTPLTSSSSPSSSQQNLPIQPQPTRDDLGDIDVAPQQATRSFNVTGKNFSFSPTEIRVKQGDKVKINFESTGGFHDWTVESYDVGTAQVNTGGQTFVEFVADKKGTFEYYCSVDSHRAMGMVGKLIV